MAYAVSYAQEHGLFSDEIDTIREAQKRLSEIHELAPDIVPSYILTNFVSLSDTVNNGSHSKYEEEETGQLAVDSDVLSGNAPYLTRVAFYQLMTIFHWLHKLPISSDEIETLRIKIDAMLDNPIALYEGCECYLQYDEGVWHYGSCAVREHERYPLSEQTLVRLYNVQPNKNYATRKRYPYYAHYDIVFMTL